MLQVIGVSSIDPRGYDALMKAFRVLRPTAIAVDKSSMEALEEYMISTYFDDAEVVEAGVQRFLEDKVYKYSDPETVRLYLRNVYNDTRAASDYARASGIQVLCCTSDEDADTNALEQAPILPLYSTLHVSSSLLRMTPKEYETIVYEEYENKELPVAQNPWLTVLYRARDARIQEALRSLPEDAVFVTGIERLYGDYHPNLAQRLEDLQPHVRKLIEFR